MCFSNTAPKQFPPPMKAGSEGGFAPASVYASGVPQLTDAGAQGGGDVPPGIQPGGGIGPGILPVGGGGGEDPTKKPIDPYMWVMQNL